MQREGLTPDDMDDPDLAVAGPLMSAIANQPATGIQLFRGARATPRLSPQCSAVQSSRSRCHPLPARRASGSTSRTIRPRWTQSWSEAAHPRRRDDPGSVYRLGEERERATLRMTSVSS